MVSINNQDLHYTTSCNALPRPQADKQSFTQVITPFGATTKLSQCEGPVTVRLFLHSRQMLTQGMGACLPDIVQVCRRLVGIYLVEHGDAPGLLPP